MSASHHPLHRPLPDGTYVELVSSLCGTRVPGAIMSALFVTVAALAAVRSGDGLVVGALAMGTLASAARLAVLFHGRRICDAGSLSLETAMRFEHRFAVSYVLFAAIFGCFAARALMLPLPGLQLPVGILVVGYAAGVAATVALRPRIAITSLLLAVVPAAIAIGLNGDAEHLIAAFCLVALLVGGMRSLLQRYGSQAAKTAKRQAFAQLARHDHLTGLSNRLALNEAFERLAGRCVSVHYIDLDDFKPVNDRLGHLAGDTLLCLVAERLRAEAEGEDVVARLGGDEFIYLQVDVSSLAAAAEKGRSLERRLGAPYRVTARSIVVGASVGTSLPAAATGGLDVLTLEADTALRARKSERKATRPAAALPMAAQLSAI